MNPLVAEAAVLGDRRKFPSVLIAPQFSALESWAREHGIAFADRRELISRREVKDLYEGAVHERRFKDDEQRAELTNYLNEVRLLLIEVLVEEEVWIIYHPVVRVGGPRP